MAPRATVKVFTGDFDETTEEIAEVVSYDVDGSGRYAEILTPLGGRFYVSQHRIMIHP